MSYTDPTCDKKFGWVPVSCLVPHDVFCILAFRGTEGETEVLSKQADGTGTACSKPFQTLLGYSGPMTGLGQLNN